MKYAAEYNNSWALIIGINEYQHVNPLGYACNDANAISELLVSKFDFPESNVTLLLDENATKSNIMRSLLRFANGNTDPNDRIIVFYAGHGHTITGRRGEIGYLVPYDGDCDDISTLIRWDELTRNSELIDAKHILYVMDACYGGLAITRSLQAGSVRFLKDMLCRSSRQVITAGKADEVVADSNGPIPGHSIFTGHLIQALNGEAAQADGVITANGIMSYVYEKVSKDIFSKQTPHFGIFDGDGDFIFKAPILESLSESDVKDNDVLIEVPAPFDYSRTNEISIIEKSKEFLSDHTKKIKFDDFVNNELRRYYQQMSSDNFSLKAPITDEESFVRINKYENVSSNLCCIFACICYWGEQTHASVLKRIILRSTDGETTSGGFVHWINLKTYPTILLLYYGGISSLASDNYSNLYNLLHSSINKPYQDDSVPLIIDLFSDLSGINNIFKKILDNKNYYYPRSEYLFKQLQPQIDDLFFVGRDYERLFDTFEVFLALVYVDLKYENSAKEIERVWGPQGRFAWKYERGLSEFTNIRREADKQKERWAPLKAGFFSGSYERFCIVHNNYAEFMGRVNIF